MSSLPNFKIRHFLAISIFGLSALACIGLFSLTPRSDLKPPGTAQIEEQRTMLRQSFDLAKQLYVTGRYSLCLAELAKIREVTAQYRNSGELKAYCEQGQILFLREQDLHIRESNRVEQERKIAAIVDNCKPQLEFSPTVETIRQCLAPAIEMNPENHLVLEMIYTTQMREAERRAEEDRKQAEKLKAHRGIVHFQRCKELHSEARLAIAKDECESFVATPYPQSAENKVKARREIASIRLELSTQIEKFIGQCKYFYAKGLLKEAHLACARVLSETPANSTAKGMDKTILAKLRRYLKSTYEDSVLEESFGNVDSAKDKWLRILQEDLENGDYAQKAKGKLERYGFS